MAELFFTRNKSTRNKSIFAACSLVAFALLTRMVVFSGIDGSDSSIYSQLSYAIATGTFSIETAHSMRPGLLYPVALVFSVLGPSEVTAVIYPLLMSLVEIVAVIVIGRQLLGPGVGWLAGALLALFPAHAILSTQLMPDLPSAAWVTLGVGALVLARQHVRVHPARISAVGAGVMLGVAVLGKEIAIIFVPVFLLLAAMLFEGRERSIAVLLVLVGFTVVVGFELGYFQVMSGTPLPQLGLPQLYHPPGIWGPAYGGLRLFQRVTLDFWVMLLAKPLFFGYYYWFLLSAVAFLVLRRASKSSWLVFIWLAMAILYHEFSSITFTTYLPIPLIPRYQSYSFAPLVLLVAWWLNEMWKASERGFGIRLALALSLVPLFVLLFLVPWLKYALGIGEYRFLKADVALGGLGIMALAGILIGPRTKLALPGWETISRGLAPACLLLGLLLPWRYLIVLHQPNAVCERQIAAVLGGVPDRPVYSDVRTARVLSLFYNYRMNDYFREYPAKPIVGPAYVAANWDWLRGLSSTYGVIIPDFAYHPPASWEQVLSNGRNIDRRCDLYLVPGN